MDAAADNVRAIKDGTDLDYVLEILEDLDPIEVESDPTEKDWAVHATIRTVQDKIAHRRSATLGVNPAEPCGTSSYAAYPACGPEVGQPTCPAHRDCQYCGKVRDHTVWACPAKLGRSA